VVEVNGRRLEVTLPAGFAAGVAPAAAKKAAPKRSAARKTAGAVSGDTLTAPMQGTIVRVAVSDGDTVAAGDLVVVLEAMKMEQPITAHKAGTVTALNAQAGAVVTSGAAICEIKE
jgi:acetyl-CoA/propionyl-CoA carboxylase biotin carboxyl carrier protein